MTRDAFTLLTNMLPSYKHLYNVDTWILVEKHTILIIFSHNVHCIDNLKSAQCFLCCILKVSPH